jgi:hypothetical protein
MPEEASCAGENPKKAKSIRKMIRAKEAYLLNYSGERMCKVLDPIARL